MYDTMERGLDESGAAFLEHGETSQSLLLSDIFTLKDGSITPVLKVLVGELSSNKFRVLVPISTILISE